MPRKDGQDRDGLSVSIEDEQLTDVHKHSFETDGHRGCQIRVSSVREIPPLDVAPDPIETDPSHALIIGIPDRTLGVEQLAATEYMAQELSRRAGPYTFPESLPQELQKPK